MEVILLNYFYCKLPAQKQYFQFHFSREPVPGFQLMNLMCLSLEHKAGTMLICYLYQMTFLINCFGMR